MANVHGIDRLQVVPVDQPPVYDLDQIEGEVTDTIARSERNLKIKVAMIGLGSGAGRQDECNAPGSLEELSVLCESIVAIANTIESAIEEAESAQVIEQIQQQHARSDPALAPTLSADVDRVLSSNLIQLRLASATATFISVNTDIDLDSGSATVPSGYRLVTSVRQVEAVGSRVDSKVLIRVHGQASLISNADDSILETYIYAAETPAFLIERWEQGGIGLLSTAFSDVIAELAEVLTEEVLLTVTSPKLRRKGYLVEPLEPRNKKCLFGCDFTTLKNYGYYELETLQPSFEWEDFESQYRRDPLYADLQTTRPDVTYDLRIFRSRPGFGSILMTGNQIYEFQRIQGTSFTPELSLVPCTPYTWTVRARFKIDGKIHLTRWSGNYDEKDIETFRKKYIAESSGARTSRAVAGFLEIDHQEYWREQSYYFPFLAPGLGKRCKPADVRSAIELAE